MEFTVTKEFVREAHSAACSTWKTKIEKEFPDLFKPTFEVNKWYKSDIGGLWCISRESTEQNQYSFGFNRFGEWQGESLRQSRDLVPATTEEVESTLIAEAKKKGYVGKNIIMIEGLKGLPSYHIMSGKFSFEAGQNQLICDCGDYGRYTIFLDGKWAEILPEQKTIITKGKALRIIAKKIKVSPESIEIQ